MGTKEDIAGKKYNRLTLVRPAYKKGTRWIWECLCDCGNITFLESYAVKSGHTKSCGCLYLETRGKTRLVHGGCKELASLYHIWENMKARCFNPKSANYSHYGARGITVCDEWRQDFQSFINWSVANNYEYGLSIERLNVDGNYEPTNCKWIPRNAQGRNKRNSRRVIVDGEEVSLSEYFYSQKAEESIDYYNFSCRISLGWTLEKALSTPVNKRTKKDNVHKMSLDWASNT